MTPIMLASVGADETACWNWAGCLDRNGYGKVGRAGRIMAAHRVMYEALVGVIPDGLEIDHLCRNTRCVNPQHLEPVTRAENQRRRAAAQTECKRGHAYNEANTRFRVDGARVCRVCIRERYAARAA